MAIIKNLTPEERKMKNALELRVLSLYREKRKLDKEQSSLDERINHLERQIANVGGPGLDFKGIFKKD